MARILTYTSPARGHLYPVTPILDELRRRGHQIVVRTLASEVASMRARGFAAAPISRAVEAIEHDDWHSRQPRAALASTVRVFCRRAVFDAADLQHAIGAEQPDALLVDVSSWGGLTVAEAWGGPWATFCPYPLPLSSPDVAPYGPGLAPSRGPLGRLRDRLVRPVVVGTIEKTMMPAVNDVRGSSGLRPVAAMAGGCSTRLL